VDLVQDWWRERLGATSGVYRNAHGENILERALGDQDRGGWQNYL
jgi:hypothetical protein